MLFSAIKKLCLTPKETLSRYRNNLKRSSAIQQGLLNISIFLISLFLLSIFTYFSVQSALSTRMDTNLQQKMALLLERDSEEDDDDDDDYKKPPRALSQVRLDKEFHLVFPQRDLRLDDNKIFRKTGYSTKELSQLSKHFDVRYRFLVEHQEGSVFVVAENNDNDQDILKIVMSIAHELKTPISRLRHDLITALDQTEQGQDALTRNLVISQKPLMHC